ncbi:fluoride efflux transporter FluC [Corynebacterium urealyticum]|uniref:fluoride efflux transporter FluC n=1 Tax=Corynebacterium urealyticum TaxID=43771 RepID=UPI0021CCEE29|nr:CrcB family protein [Corynebacterium urealyticum]
MIGALLVFTGGLLGTLARWLLTDALSTGGGGLTGQWGLLAANVLGAGLLGFVGAFFQGAGAAAGSGSSARRGWLLAGREKLLLGTGFCGAFTSYSALAGAVAFIDDAGATAVLGYFAATIVLGVCAAAAGIATGRAASQRGGAPSQAAGQGAGQRPGGRPDQSDLGGDA